MSIGNTSLEQELSSLLNRHCAENDSDTPDYILAKYLLGCLGAFTEATKLRDKWWGLEPWGKATGTPPECGFIEDANTGCRQIDPPSMTGPEKRRMMKNQESRPCKSCLHAGTTERGYVYCTIHAMKECGGGDLHHLYEHAK